MKKSRLLVVDASVARSAGETQHPVSSACREYLNSILEICHRIAVNDEIKKEWSKHKSRFTSKWLCSMAARRKPMQTVTSATFTIDIKCYSKNDQPKIQKDLCLLKAALAADKIIITRDQKILEILNKQPTGAKLAKQITWINPDTESAETLKSMQTKSPHKKNL
ncbi:MAG: hypothetical protein JW841_10610 [Deltaproteobacteria bacterium]|nr:hypothetical protein [Deltaproteobacteria bacterium]